VDDDRLLERVARLEEQVQSLIVSVRYRRDEPWERTLLTLGITGEERVNLMMVLAAVLQRAVGEVPSRPRDTSRAHPAVVAATEDAPVDRSEALLLVSEVASCSPVVAARLFKAWADRGLGEDANASLGF
jgi:hypothetical protein